MYLNDDFDDSYSQILENDDPSLITIVSELRHYVNVHYITKKLLEYFKTDSKTINKIYKGCFGNCNVRELLANEDLLISEIQKRSDIEKSKEHAINIIQQRIEKLIDKRVTFCGIGTNKIKRRLNKLSKHNYLAQIYRIALEAEDKNVQAKNVSFYYSDRVYAQKDELLKQLVELFRENNLIYGKTDSNIPGIHYILYFEIPNCEQISFHNNLPNPTMIPNYEKEWDGKENSTLDKLETGILITFPDINK